MDRSVRILVMGLPGSGKTTLADALHSKFDSSLRLNADRVRALYDDWDFSYEGRIRQAQRMFSLASVSEDALVIADFVCPMPEMRDIFKPDMLIWLDTTPAGRFEDTNKLFVPPDRWDFRIKSHESEPWADVIAACISRRYPA